MKPDTIAYLDKNKRDRVRSTILSLFPIDKEVFVYHPNTNQLLVSNFGNIKRGIQGKILKPFKNRNGYDMVNVEFNDGRGRRCVFVHRLVAETFYAFFDNSDYIFEVNHINGNKNNNTLYNLEWMTRNENLQHARDMKLFKSGGYVKFSLQEVQDMRELHKLGFKINEISRSYKCDRNYLSQILKGKYRNVR